MASFDLDFVCVGPQRTGTTWVYEMLQRHPDLCLPEVVKETMFFDRFYDRGIEWYSQYFQPSHPNQLCGEVAPTYFDSLEVPHRIREISPLCEIVVTLRDPVERAWSLFLHHLKKGRVSEDFWKAVDRIPRIVEAGRYKRHLERWNLVFGTEQVTTLFHEDLSAAPRKVLSSIRKSLNVKPFPPVQAQRKRFNDTSMSRFPTLARGVALLTTTLHKYGFHKAVGILKGTGIKSLIYSGGEQRTPEISASIRKVLLDKYEPDITYIEKKTEQDLSQWREK